MKHFFSMIAVMMSLVMLLSGCTSGGNVSERDDGMVGDTTGRRTEETHETTAEHSGAWDEEREDDNAARSRRIVRRR